jgi:hypothetical protein
LVNDDSSPRRWLVCSKPLERPRIVELHTRFPTVAHGTAKAMTEKLELSEAAELLNEPQVEEEEADKKLTGVAGSLYEEVLPRHEVTEDQKEEAVPIPSIFG